MSDGNHTGNITIAQRYSDALIKLADEKNMLDEFASDLNLLNAALDQNPDLKKFLEHPTIENADKKEVVQNIFKGKISDYILNTLKLLLDRNRVFILPSIACQYISTLRQKRNIVVANVITAIEIDDETLQKLKEKLQNVFEQKIEIEKKVDADIVAGVIVKVGDRILDGSIKNKIETMKKQLI